MLSVRSARGNYPKYHCWIVTAQRLFHFFCTKKLLFKFLITFFCDGALLIQPKIFFIVCSINCSKTTEIINKFIPKLIEPILSDTNILIFFHFHCVFSINVGDFPKHNVKAVKLFWFCLLINVVFYNFVKIFGVVLEWLKRHAWKACIRHKRIPSSNLGHSAIVKYPYRPP